MLPYLRRRAREIRSALRMYTAAYEPKERGAAREHQAVVPRKRTSRVTKGANGRRGTVTSLWVQWNV